MAEKQTVELIKSFREQMEQQMQQHKRDMDTLLKLFGVQQVEGDSSGYFSAASTTVSIPPFAAFDSTTELWPGYWSRFRTFVAANAVPEQRMAQVFLTNQTATIYKQLANLATQQNPPKDINNLTMDEIVDFMKEQFDRKLFIVRERFKFWSDMQQKPGKTLQELAALWKQLGRPKLQDVKHRYESASKHNLPVLGTFMGQTKDPTTGKQDLIPYIVTKISDLNLLERNAIQTLGISVDTALDLKSIDSQAKREGAEVLYPKTSSEPYVSLQQDCHNMCDEFPDLFKQELGCLKNFELEVKFKLDATPVFHKARLVPFALRDDLAKGYEEGIAKGIWKPVQFNEYGTPVVPIRKAHASSNLKPKLWICGDYSVGINDQLADHRHPMPLQVELMQKLGGGFGYTKIDLADAYNQIKLAPEMAVFQDDMLVSGKDANSHLNNLKCLLTHLSDNGLRCRREKCQFALPSVKYRGHILSTEGMQQQQA
ncbi:uncharacterized protein K02A2.6-like [Octopus bimaculoides]|uniref:uncharacterized protein K02A2.6-like n=1 Tax=Octopus bimaculoides TaxID=37653 RepID=UPI0022E59F6C|nr:uncharacterized protein K02A2.6-like [Octopus bimaculoides]